MKDQASAPVEVPAVEAEPDPSRSEDDIHAVHSVRDEFEAAAKLFSFTGETPVQVVQTAVAAKSASRPRRRRGSAFRRATAATATVGAMGIVGLLAIGMTTPAEALAAASGGSTAGSVTMASDVAAAKNGDIQAYVVPADAQGVTFDRSDYETASLASIAADTGVTQPSNFYSNDPNAAIQWPFAVGVSISYGFGPRPGEFHEGADFVPGAGAHVQAIAAGTVRIATESGGGYGVMVLIDHLIDGKVVSTRYGHMEYGSLQVKVGDTVKAGQYLGRTGDTGFSFGAHTHVEVLQDGTTPIDPIAWLRENAGRKTLGD